jgi:hypothetical protein
MAFGSYLATAPRVLTPEEEAAIAAEAAAAQGQPAAAPPPPPEGQAVAPGSTQTTTAAPPPQEYVAPPPAETYQYGEPTSYADPQQQAAPVSDMQDPAPQPATLGATQTTQPQYQASAPAEPAVSSGSVEDGAVGLARPGYPSAQGSPNTASGSASYGGESANQPLGNSTEVATSYPNQGRAQETTYRAIAPTPVPFNAQAISPNRDDAYRREDVNPNYRPGMMDGGYYRSAQTSASFAPDYSGTDRVPEDFSREKLMAETDAAYGTPWAERNLLSEMAGAGITGLGWARDNLITPPDTNIGRMAAINERTPPAYTAPPPPPEERFLLGEMVDGARGGADDASKRILTQPTTDVARNQAMEQRVPPDDIKPFVLPRRPASPSVYSGAADVINAKPGPLPASADTYRPRTPADQFRPLMTEGAAPIERSPTYPDPDPITQAQLNTDDRGNWLTDRINAWNIENTGGNTWEDTERAGEGFISNAADSVRRSTSGGGTQGGGTPPTWAEAGPAMRAALTGQPMPQAATAGEKNAIYDGVPIITDANGLPVAIGRIGQDGRVDVSGMTQEVFDAEIAKRKAAGAAASPDLATTVGLDAQGNVTTTPQAATTPQPQTVTQNSSESGGSSGGSGWVDYGNNRSSGGSSQRSYDYPRSSSKRGTSVGQMFADDGEEMDLNDFLKDYNGNGEVDEEDRRTAGKRFASYKKKRGRKSKTSTKSGFSNVPQREDSPIRTKTLDAIKTSTRKSGKR